MQSNKTDDMNVPENEIPATEIMRRPIAKERTVGTAKAINMPRYFPKRSL
jgi:hypothetical protein